MRSLSYNEMTIRFRYFLVAVQYMGLLSFSSLILVNCNDDDPPNPPSNLIGVVIAPTGIRLAWRDNSNDESRFRIERSSNAGITWSHLANTAANAATFSDTGLSESYLYQYRVRAENSEGSSGYSNVAVVTTATAVPASPGALTATAISAVRIDLTWADHSDNETGFKIERASGTASGFSEIASVAANVTSYRDSDLSSRTNYVYRIKAFRNSTYSPYTNTAAATTLSPPPILTAPSSSTGSFNLILNYSWPSIVSTADKYEVEQSTTSSTTGFSVIHTSSDNTHTSPYPIPLNRSSGTYYFRGRVFERSAWSDYSDVIQTIVTTSERRITIINNCSSAQFLNEIVRVKVASTQGGLNTRNDLLTDDPANCVSQFQSIERGESQTFSIALGNTYYVFLGMGRYEPDMFCPASSVYFKRNWTTDLTTGRLYYIWTQVHVTGHAEGNMNWTILGSLSNGDLRITGPSFSTPVFFTRTLYDPID